MLSVPTRLHSDVPLSLTLKNDFFLGCLVIGNSTIHFETSEDFILNHQLYYVWKSFFCTKKWSPETQEFKGTFSLAS